MMSSVSFSESPKNRRPFGRGRSCSSNTDSGGTRSPVPELQERRGREIIFRSCGETAVSGFMVKGLLKLPEAAVAVSLRLKGG